MRHSTAMVNELNAAKRLILKHFELVIGSLMHISGLSCPTHRVALVHKLKCISCDVK
jgi:hypothetical protein